MNRYLAFFLTAGFMLICLVLRPWSAFAQAPVFQLEECVTIHWDGRDNTHVIRPNGNVEFLGKLLGSASRPARTEERSFYMNVAMNALAKEGYQFAGRTENDIVMRRVFAK